LSLNKKGLPEDNISKYKIIISKYSEIILANCEIRKSKIFLKVGI
jgi:hypothetical protein